MEPENISVSVYRNSIPSHVDPELEQLYEHRYASFQQLKTYEHITEDTNTYEVRKNGKAIVILLFRVEHEKVLVLNEQIRISEEEIERFAHHIFATFSSVTIISFPVIQTDMRRLSYPRQLCHSTQDIVLALPSTVEEYTACLGKATRSYVKRRLKRLKRDFPSASFDVYLNEDISEQQIHDIIEFNRKRMAAVNKSSYIDDEEERRMRALAKRHGFVGVLTIDGRICAGTINFHFGRNYFLQVLAHDPAYDAYGLGTLTCYLTICDCIARGGNEYHFLWGQYEYKYRLLGVQRDLDHLAVYRSRFYLLRHCDMAFRIALAGYQYTIRSWLQHKGRREDKSSRMSQLLFHAVNGLRDVKRFARRAPQDREKVELAPATRPNE